MENKNDGSNQIQDNIFFEKKDQQKDWIFDFAYNNWSQSLRKQSIKSEILSLDEDFIKYLRRNGCFINPKYSRNKDSVVEDLDECPEFPQIAQKIEQTIEKYDYIFIKLIWKAPRDCLTWLRDLKVSHIEDVMHLLKNSNLLTEYMDDYFESFDLKNPRKGIYLIMKKFYDVEQSREFRLFVYKRKLIAVCQRHTGEFYKDMDQIYIKNEPRILEWLEKQIFPEFQSQQNFVVDIYLEKKQDQEDRIWLIDLNPWKEFTNPLMFTFEELEEGQNKQQSNQIIIKTVKSLKETIVQDYSSYRVPHEFSDGNIGQWNELFQTLKDAEYQ